MSPRYSVPGAAPLRDLVALAVVLVRFVTRAASLARRELDGWHAFATRIADPDLRHAAITTLRSERLSAFGAALIACTGDRAHQAALVRALVAYQVAWDYLDTLAEQPAHDVVANGVQLHRALVDALEPEQPTCDYYRLHRASNDSGYLAALVDACRHSCAGLPNYELVRADAVEKAMTATVQGLNHAPHADRGAELQRWIAEQGAATSHLTWMERAACASSSLGVLAMLASAGDASSTPARFAQLRAVYVPWADTLTTLLDSLVDQEQDAATGSLSFVSHYPSAEAATARLREITAALGERIRLLPHGERHVVIVGGMIALHLSTAGARHSAARPAAEAVLDAYGSPVPRLLIRILSGWRALQSRSTTASIQR